MNQQAAPPVTSRDTARDTYRYLRGGMAIMIVMLAASVILERLSATCFQVSISAYYYTSAHGVFVATLCSIGAMLIVYRGSTDTEDVLLNLAGVLAFVVAMVPTSRPATLCGIGGIPPEYVVTHSSILNVWSVVIALTIAAVLSAWQYWRTGSQGQISVLGTVMRIVFWGVVAVGIVGLIWFGDLFSRQAHNVAAVTMFAAIIVTVALTAYVVRRQDPELAPSPTRYYKLYRWVFRIMVATLILVIGLHLFVLRAWQHAVIVIESALILEFAAYWAIQTVELWNSPSPSREDLVSPKDRELLVSKRTDRKLGRLVPDARAVLNTPHEERLMRAL